VSDDPQLPRSVAVGGVHRELAQDDLRGTVKHGRRMDSASSPSRSMIPRAVRRMRDVVDRTAAVADRRA
jgi:hypothetical protein